MIPILPLVSLPSVARTASAAIGDPYTLVYASSLDIEGFVSLKCA